MKPFFSFIEILAVSTLSTKQRPVRRQISSENPEKVLHFTGNKTGRRAAASFPILNSVKRRAAQRTT